MSVELRFPNITGATEREQLSQVKSYLHQLVEQLQWALQNVDVTTNPVATITTAKSQTVTSKPSGNDAQVTFNELKPLIIKSAEIVSAYYEEISSRLVSEYSALSEFGAYSERTEKLVRDTAAFTEETYSKLAEIDANYDGVAEYISQTKGYIKTGIIVDSLSAEEAKDYNKKEGDSLIGIEVGDYDNNGSFQKFARFTSNRLSFYDQSKTEVAWISNSTLHINNVEVEEDLVLGGYLIDTTNGLTFKWVGGKS
jgi:hypothetical protein